MARKPSMDLSPIQKPFASLDDCNKAVAKLQASAATAGCGAIKVTPYCFTFQNASYYIPGKTESEACQVFVEQILGISARPASEESNKTIIKMRAQLQLTDQDIAERIAHVATLNQYTQSPEILAMAKSQEEAIERLKLRRAELAELTAEMENPKRSKTAAATPESAEAPKAPKKRGPKPKNKPDTAATVEPAPQAPVAAVPAQTPAPVAAAPAATPPGIPSVAPPAPAPVPAPSAPAPAPVPPAPAPAPVPAPAPAPAAAPVNLPPAPPGFPGVPAPPAPPAG